MDYSQRQAVVASLSEYAKSIDVDSLLRTHGSPLCIFDARIMRRQYESLQTLFPGVKFYFALKASGHADAVRVIKQCNGYIDVATTGEIELVQSMQFPMDHCMHTHPIKKPHEIDEAYAAGIRRFVVENRCELEKFTGRPDDIEIMIRLSFPNPEAKSNLSYKFGATMLEAKELVRTAQQNGVRVAGFCMHVGSQIHSADAYVTALHETVRMMEDLESELTYRFTVLDIGGGFPIEYRDSVPAIEAIADAINPVIAPLRETYDIIAEPGRFIAGPSMLSVLSVVGTNERYGMPWYYVDDGLYGLHSNIMFEDVHAHFIARRELDNPVSAGDLHSSVLAGPTCDSVDILSNDYALPKLQVGDYILSPNMGAYTWVSATTFNGIPKPTMVTIGATRE